MKSVRYLLILAAIMTIALRSYAHEGEKNEGPQKVTSKTISAGNEATGQASEGEEIEMAAAQAAEKDFETIRQEVTASTAFVVIKALALAGAIGGLAFLYLPRRGKGGSQ